MFGVFFVGKGRGPFLYCLCFCFVLGYCGIRLSTCWTMILNKNETLKYGVRDPFPVIAYEVLL
jgi:hypothetical protein